MKFKISQDEFDKLSESLQAEYQEKDGEYVLDLEGVEDTSALKRAKDHEKKRRQDAEKKAKELEDQLQSLQDQIDDLDNKGGKEDNLSKKWEKKLQDREKELSDQITALKGNLQEILVDGVAKSMAAELSDSPSLLMPHIKGRLIVDMENGKPVTKILDSDGELSASTLDEFKNEVSSNKEFAAIIRGSGASGGGAEGGKGGSGTKLEKPDFSKASPKEVAEYLKSQKEA